MKARLNATGLWVMTAAMVVALAVGAREAWAARPEAMRSCPPGAIGTCTSPMDCQHQCDVGPGGDGFCNPNGCCFCIL